MHFIAISQFVPFGNLGVDPHKHIEDNIDDNCDEASGHDKLYLCLLPKCSNTNLDIGPCNKSGVLVYSQSRFIKGHT